VTGRLTFVAGLVAAVGLAGPAALASTTPVGPLPSGPTETVSLGAGATFTATLPKSQAPGRVWRIARAFDSSVVRELSEGETTKAVRVTFRAVGSGTTTVVFALTKGETAHAEAAHTFRVVVGGSGCPSLLPLPADPISPAVAAALKADPAKNKPQVTGAVVAPQDVQRGAQVKARCGPTVWQRTVVVSITDRAFLPSQSLSQRVVFVGRTSSGWRVWQRAH
jgi:hypothetical protein